MWLFTLVLAMILAYGDRIMATTQSPPNRVREHRRLRGWSQMGLAERAGISRAAVSAIETSRLVPSVAAALSLASAFGCSVESLFGPVPGGPAEPRWAWAPARSPSRYWLAQVRGRTLRYPVEATEAGVIAHDGVFRDGAFLPVGDTAPESTLVVACCDPAVGLLAAEYARSSGFRLLAFPRRSQQALDLLARGLVHVAGVHFATREEPRGNEAAVRETLGGGARLLRVARWEEGLAVAAGAAVTSVGTALRAKLRWVGREPGSAARRCLDELRQAASPPRRLAYDHRGVAEAVRCGWADVGVCHRLAADEAGLRFFTVRREQFDLCYPAAAEDDPRVVALVRVVRSARYRSLLGELPGYDAAPAGETRATG
jgi:molybdate-binding protein/DNA-binding XRE family transcriptional regulator